MVEPGLVRSTSPATVESCDAPSAGCVPGRRTLATPKSRILAWPRSVTKTFAGLMLAAAHGDAMDVAPVVETFGLRLTSVDEYARSVLGLRRRLDLY